MMRIIWGEVVEKYENIFAGLIYISAIIFGPIVPFICFIIFRNDKFIKFHSLQSLLLSIIYLLVGTGIVLIYFYFIGIPSLTGKGGIALSNSVIGPLDSIFYYFLILWWAFYVILCVFGAYNSSRGRIYEYPLIGTYIRKRFLQTTK